MDKIYYIENTIDEFHTKIKGYFKSFDEAKEALEKCSNWYRPEGTIYVVEFGLGKRPEKLYETW